MLYSVRIVSTGMMAPFRSKLDFTCSADLIMKTSSSLSPIGMLAPNRNSRLREEQSSLHLCEYRSKPVPQRSTGVVLQQPFRSEPAFARSVHDKRGVQLMVYGQP